jgi:hypothetical protein
MKCVEEIVAYDVSLTVRIIISKHIKTKLELKIGKKLYLTLPSDIDISDHPRWMP